jgi:hypothetical protein
MLADGERWWSLTPRRRRAATWATVLAALLTMAVAGPLIGWSDWRAVLGLACTVAGFALMTTTITAPMVGDRADRSSPAQPLDKRTRRRAWRCIRKGDTRYAPAGLDLQQVALDWGWEKVRSLRMALWIGLIFLGGAVYDEYRWMQIVGLGYLALLIAVVPPILHDVRLCRRFLIETFADQTARILRPTPQTPAGRSPAAAPRHRPVYGGRRGVLGGVSDPLAPVSTWLFAYEAQGRLF